MFVLEPNVKGNRDTGLDNQEVYRKNIKCLFSFPEQEDFKSSSLAL